MLDVQTQSGDLDLAGAGSLPPDQALARLESSTDGLTTDEAARRLAQDGPNVLATRRVRAFDVLGRQLRNPILLLLLAAALVSGFTGDRTNAVIIAVIVALSVGLGFFNEYHAEKAMASLRSMITHDAEVRRDGQSSKVSVNDLVPGDIVILGIGDLVPADLRLIEVDNLECDEGVLTGESMPVTKSIASVTGHDGLDQPGCAFMGTIVSQGSGVGVVVCTGARTAFGTIAAGLSDNEGQSAFDQGLVHFSRFLFAVATVLTTFIFVANVMLHRPLLQALLFSLAIAVGMAPEMMPAIVTVSLSAGSKVLAAKKVMVKRLVAIEDLGNIEILFTDKTGTLTTGVITFVAGLDASGQKSDRPLLLGLICNEATPTDKGPVGGNPLDQALWSAPAAAAGGQIATAAAGYQRLAALPFDNVRQLASVLVKDPAGHSVIITKGAPEVVLDRCTDVPEGARAVLQKQFAEGARVVALATRPVQGMTAVTAADEKGLALVGFVTFADPPKADAAASIDKLRKLGVEVKIITGDNGLVAAKVCSDIGLENTGVLTGTDVKSLDDDQLMSKILTTTVFARISPDQKARIVTTVRSGGKDVAFLGDGVNDAVALHHADVGISVDSGTDVAKDAADVVLLDKDLGVLADGVTEGRRVFANTMKYVLMSTSSNFGNMFSAAGASVVLSFLPMLPSQILLNNLLYDTGQMAISTDEVDSEDLARPAHWDLAFVRRFMIVFGPLSSIFDFVTFWVMLSVLHAGPTEFRTGWFVESIATQTLVVYIIRTRRVPFFRSRPSTPMLMLPTGAALVGAVLPFTGLAGLLGFTPLPLSFFLILAAMVVIYLFLVEGAKMLFYRSAAAKTPAPETTEATRRARHVRRRASRFVRILPPSGKSQTRSNATSTPPPTGAVSASPAT